MRYGKGARLRRRYTKVQGTLQRKRRLWHASCGGVGLSGKGPPRASSPAQSKVLRPTATSLSQEDVDPATHPRWYRDSRQHVTFCG